MNGLIENSALTAQTELDACQFPIVIANREHGLAVLLAELLTDEQLPVQVFVDRVHGYADDLVTLIGQVQARVCIFGLTYPYAESWDALQSL